MTAISTLALNQKIKPDCSCKEFTQINYQDLVDYLLEPALNQNISDKTAFIIREYLQSLSQPTIDDENTNQKQGIMMALGKEEGELLSNFWSKNKKLIMSALHAISIDKNTDEDTSKIIGEAIADLNKRTENGKKIGKYVISTMNELCEKDLLSKAEIVNLQDKDYCKTTFDQGTYEVFRHSSQSITDDKGIDRYYKKYKFCGKYKLTNDWFEKHWDKFLEWEAEMRSKQNTQPKQIM